MVPLIRLKPGIMWQMCLGKIKTFVLIGRSISMNMVSYLLFDNNEMKFLHFAV